jgi:hypothetical protein
MIWKAGKYASDLKKRNNGREIVASWDVAWTEGNKACPKKRVKKRVSLTCAI